MNRLTHNFCWRRAMRKWWWTGLFAIALMPQTVTFGQEGEKKAEEKKAEEKKAEAKPTTPANPRAVQQAAFNEIRALIAKKDFEGAEKLVNGELESNPDWPLAMSASQSLMMGYANAGNKEKAGEWAVKAV